MPEWCALTPIMSILITHTFVSGRLKAAGEAEQHVSSQERVRRETKYIQKVAELCNLPVKFSPN